MHMGEGFLLVYSITSHDSIEEINTLHQKILRLKNRDSFPMIVVANKCDLEYERQIGTNEGLDHDLAKQLGCKLIETSARHGVNVDEAFSNLVREIREYNNEQQTSCPALPGSGGGSSGAHGGKDQHIPGCCARCVVL